MNLIFVCKAGQRLKLLNAWVWYRLAFFNLKKALATFLKQRLFIYGDLKGKASKTGWEIVMKNVCLFLQEMSVAL